MTESKSLVPREPAPGLANVVLVGRPNVGKSTLFNRLVGRRKALVHGTPGLTRDLIRGEVEWVGRSFSVTDTAGLDAEAAGGVSGGELAGLVLARSREAIEEADLVLFVTDARAGLTTSDEILAEQLRRAGKAPVMLVVNKAEGRLFDLAAAEFSALGLGPAFCVSAEHGDGTAELLDAVVERLGESVRVEPPSETEEAVELTIVGRPNVGKSLLFNLMIGRSRALVSAVAGTTRDPVDAEVLLEGVRLRLVDTAGLRRRGRVHEAPEALSVAQTRRCIERARLALVVLDATQPLAHQDGAVAGMAAEAGKGVILVLNKWDLVSAPSRRLREIESELGRGMKFLSWAPRVTVSALTGQGLQGLVRAVARTDRAHCLRVSTAELNRFVSRHLSDVPLRTARSEPARILYATQVGVRPPSFAFFLNKPAVPHFSTRRFVENRLRRALTLEGSPVRLSFRAG